MLKKRFGIAGVLTKSWTGYLCQMNILLKRKCHRFCLGRCMSSFFSQHHLFALVHTCQEEDKTEDKGKIKVKREKCECWMLSHSSSHAFVFQITSQRTSRFHSLSSTGFYVHWKCLKCHCVCCIPRAKETKCGFLKTDSFQWLCFTLLCFFAVQFWLNWRLNLWI